MSGKFTMKALPLLAAAALMLAKPAPAMAGTVILEGSDAIGFHSGGNAAATAYRDQVWFAIGGSDPRPIAVIGSCAVAGCAAGIIGSGTHPIERYASVAAAEAAHGGGLGDYVALYMVAIGGCCTEDLGVITAPGAAASVAAYEAAGGTVMIEDYTGATQWDFLVGAGGAGNAHVGGVGGSQPGPGCDDGETVTADGIANGFTQPTPMGCWTHQGYDTSFFGPLGFTLSFFDSPVAYSISNPPPEGPWSSLLSSGRTVVGGAEVPEPATLTLLGLGGALSAYRRRRRRA